MTAITKAAIVLEDARSFYLGIESTLRTRANLTRCQTEDEYTTKYLASDNYDFQIIDINLGLNERVGWEIARDIAELRRKRGKKLAPCIIISAYQDVLEKIEKMYSDTFDYFLWKGSNTFHEELVRAVDDLLSRGTDICEQLEATVKTRITEYANFNGISIEDAEQKIMNNVIPSPSIPLDEFRTYETGFKEKNTIKDLLDECKNETDDERRDVVRKLVLHELERMEKEHLVQQ